MDWQLWKAGPVARQIDGIEPLLASWEKSSHPAQVRLRAYLGAVVRQLSPLPNEGPLFLHLDVDVGDSKRLLKHYDLENYLTPLFGTHSLPAAQFVLVSARKYVGGGSRITCGTASPVESVDETGWSHFSLNAGRGASQHGWKERIHNALVLACTSPMPPGPVRVRLAWKCAASRNWCALWKPTGDAMGAVLGMSDALKPYQLNDDRIVDLELHRHVDNSLGADVVVGMWWRSA